MMSTMKSLIVLSLFAFILADLEIMCPSRNVGYSKKLVSQVKEGRGPTKVTSEFIRVKVDKESQHILFENNVQQLKIFKETVAYVYEWEDVFTCTCHKDQDADYETVCFKGERQRSESNTGVLVSHSNSTVDGLLIERDGYFKYGLDWDFPGDPIFKQLIIKEVTRKLPTREFIKSSYTVGEYSGLHHLSGEEKELFKIPNFCPLMEQCV
ncbi:NapA [Acrasis kona]|uniref:NapA n=1 Tax=Acrasis kona TaxID=1008807 RepID=A0AAW2ZEV8_9EUKA